MIEENTEIYTYKCKKCRRVLTIEHFRKTKNYYGHSYKCRACQNISLAFDNKMKIVPTGVFADEKL